MSPVIVHQTSDYTQDLHYTIPSDWIIHNTMSGYMDRDLWFVAMTCFLKYVYPPT